MDAIKIPLTRGLSAVIDACDAELIQSWPYSWWADNRGYALSYFPIRPYVRMHRLLLGFPDSAIDHADGNKLNNRRSNLRLCTGSQNQANRPTKPHTSIYRGVCRHTQTGRFESNLWCGGKKFYLGIFRDEVDAARAYDRAALEHFGEFARLNFPLVTSAGFTRAGSEVWRHLK